MTVDQRGLDSTRRSVCQDGRRRSPAARTVADALDEAGRRRTRERRGSGAGGRARCPARGRRQEVDVGGTRGRRAVPLYLRLLRSSDGESDVTCC